MVMCNGCYGDAGDGFVGTYDDFVRPRGRDDRPIDLAPNRRPPGAGINPHVVQACQSGDVDTLERLGLAADLEAIDALGYSAAHIAAQHGHAAVLGFLRKAHVPIRGRTHLGHTPLDLAVANGRVLAALEILRYMPALPPNLGGHDGNSLADAARTNGHETLAAILDAISEAGSYRRWQELSMAEAEADGGADGAAAAGKTAPPRRPTVAVAVSKSGDEIELNFEIDSAAPPAPPAPTGPPGPPAPPGGAGQSPRSPPAKGEKKSPKTARI